jgi:hypothetical protein
VEHFARSIGCGKLTLEVLEGNYGAQKTYRYRICITFFVFAIILLFTSAFGFNPYELDPNTGRAMFWQKKI